MSEQRLERRFSVLLSPMRDRSGATLIFVTLVFIVLLGLAALAVDVGYVAVTRNELQNVADGAALAAARKLGLIYEGMEFEQQQVYDASSDAADIIAMAVDVGIKNRAGGKNININPAEVEIGVWRSSQLPPFQPTMSQPDAVRVTAKRATGTNGPIPTFFAKVFGVQTVQVAAAATAALTGQSWSEGFDIPVGISRKWFEEPGFCDQPIKFYPTGTIEGCAGWNVFDEGNANAATLKDILKGMIQDAMNDNPGNPNCTYEQDCFGPNPVAPPPYESPGAIGGETEFGFTGGNVAAAFPCMLNLYNCRKDDVGEWEVHVPVYDWFDCSNPRGPLTVVGFATAVITSVLPPPAMEITATVECKLVEPGRGGGNEFGTRGGIPGLVDKGPQ